MPPKPFKPPRPSTSSAVKKTTKTKTNPSTTARKSTSSTKSKSTSRASGSSAFSLPALDSSEPESESDPFASQPKAKSRPRTQIDSEEEDPITATTIPEEDERKERIPPELLTRLLHEFFKHENTRMSKDAGSAVGRYMETFVREAVARAENTVREREGGRGDGFLEVEDLEKLAPQLLMDF
ncbi:hypothetical protein OIDMADRAFT_58760 [Oidiodendron maius Zn]|uniref:Centromere protein X n=1 Tax=Oidiodendron maius (strain Zn) TaxID=913774 RepID=A0A0C3CBX0_OIDMZ|nr:hypothetical protein OIDMADRAFT_58760 [Oidiodendron maius Zn]